MERLMLHLLLVSTDQNFFANCKDAIEAYEIEALQVESCKLAISEIKNKKFDLIIADEILEGTNGIECIEKIISFNPMLNCAIVSSLAPEAFHEASEGLGVLMQLPVKPKTKDIEKLFTHLQKVLQLTNGL